MKISLQASRSFGTRLRSGNLGSDRAAGLEWLINTGQFCNSSNGQNCQSSKSTAIHPYLFALIQIHRHSSKLVSTHPNPPPFIHTCFHSSKSTTIHPNSLPLIQIHRHSFKLFLTCCHYERRKESRSML